MVEELWREMVKRGKPEISKAGKKGVEGWIQGSLWKDVCKTLLLQLLPLGGCHKQVST